MWLNNLRIYSPDGEIERGSILIRDGKIEDLLQGAARESGINCEGLAALPGIIDFHGDMLEREVEPRPGVHLPIDLGIFELDKRLAASGLTTAYPAISFAWHAKDTFRSENRAIDLIRAVNKYHNDCLTDMRVHSRFEITNHDAGQVLINLLGEHQIQLVSIMDHTPGQGQYRDIEAYIQFAMKWRREKMGMEISEEEMHENVRVAQERPKAWDTVRMVGQITQKENIPLASHDDDTPEKVAMVHDMGATISEFPVTVEAAQAARERSMYTVMGAPNALRGSSHSGNLSAADAIAEGLVDILAADYYPSALLHSIYALQEKGILPVAEGIKLISENPARALNMEGRGRLEPGMFADITLVQEGQRPRVRATVRSGVPIYWDGHMSQLEGVDLSSGYQIGHVVDTIESPEERIAS